MHFRIAVGQIVGICVGIHLLLFLVHALKPFEIVRVCHGFPVGRIREIGHDELPPLLHSGGVATACGHKVHVVVDVEPVCIVGIVGQQFVEFLACGREVLELVLEDDAHIVESLLDHFGSGRFLFLG